MSGEPINKDETPAWRPWRRARLYRRAVEAMVAQPGIVSTRAVDPFSGAPAIGLHARFWGNGFRADGSLQYGLKLPDENNFTMEDADARDRVAHGRSPFTHADAMDPAQLRQLGDFIKSANVRGIQVVGVAAPFKPMLVDLLNQSKEMGLWHEFQRSDTAVQLGQLGMQFYDFHNITRRNNLTDDYIDPYHHAERTTAHMLLEMLGNTDFQKLLPKMSADRLASLVRTPGSRFQIIEPMGAMRRAEP